VSRCPETTPAEFQAAVQAAKDAFPSWRRTPLPTRQRVMFKLQQLIREHMVRLFGYPAAPSRKLGKLCPRVVRQTPLPLQARPVQRLPYAGLLSCANSMRWAWQGELAASVTLEQGKTLPDARGDVFRGLGEFPPRVAAGLQRLGQCVLSPWCCAALIAAMCPSQP
jgi:hypothetical protein